MIGLPKKQRRQMRLLETLIEKRWFHLKELAGNVRLYRTVIEGGSFKFTNGL